MVKIDTEIKEKNLSIAPGLSLVYWGKEDARLLETIRDVREQHRMDWKRYVWWYADDHVHATLTAITRTKYGRVAPLTKKDLPDNFEEILKHLSMIPGFAIRFEKLVLRKNGQLQLFGRIKNVEHQKTLAEIRRLTRKIDPEMSHLHLPKWQGGEQAYLNLGYFQSVPTGGVSAFEEDIPQPVEVTVRCASMIHYLRRTLEPKYVLGMSHIMFGQKTDFEPGEVFKLLRL